MNWTEILKRGNVPEPPGYKETVDSFKENPYVKPKKRPSKKKGR